MCDYEDYSFVVEKAYDKIYKLAYKKAKQIYGESLPYLIAERLNKEINFIKKYNYAGYYLLAYKAVSYIRQSGEYVTNRDYSSVLVAFLLGINTANPLPLRKDLYPERDTPKIFSIPEIATRRPVTLAASTFAETSV
nr:hypothetical protein [Ruminococcus sp.]